MGKTPEDGRRPEAEGQPSEHNRLTRFNLYDLTRDQSLRLRLITKSGSHYVLEASTEEPRVLKGFRLESGRKKLRGFIFLNPTDDSLFLNLDNSLHLDYAEDDPRRWRNGEAVSALVSTPIVKMQLLSVD